MIEWGYAPTDSDRLGRALSLDFHSPARLSFILPSPWPKIGAVYVYKCSSLAFHGEGNFSHNSAGGDGGESRGAPEDADQFDRASSLDVYISIPL